MMTIADTCTRVRKLANADDATVNLPAEGQGKLVFEPRQRPKKHAVVGWLFGLVLLLAGSSPTLALEGATIEQVAASIASRYNEVDAKVYDPMTAWSSAKAVGKQVIFTYVLRVRPNLSSDELKQFRLSSITELTRRTCAVPGNHIGFDRGMAYIFVYLSESNQDLLRFSVDKERCAQARQ